MLATPLASSRSRSHGGRRSNLDAADHTRGEASAQIRRLNLNAHRVTGFGGGRFRKLRLWQGLQRQLVHRADFAREAVMRQTIRPVRRNFRVDHRAVRTFFDAADVRARKGEPRREIVRRRRHIDKVLQPVVDNLHSVILTIENESQQNAVVPARSEGSQPPPSMKTVRRATNTAQRSPIDQRFGKRP